MGTVLLKTYVTLKNYTYLEACSVPFCHKMRQVLLKSYVTLKNYTNVSPFLPQRAACAARWGSGLSGLDGVRTRLAGDQGLDQGRQGPMDWVGQDPARRRPGTRPR